MKDGKRLVPSFEIEVRQLLSQLGVSEVTAKEAAEFVNASEDISYGDNIESLLLNYLGTHYDEYMTYEQNYERLLDSIQEIGSKISHLSGMQDNGETDLDVLNELRKNAENPEHDPTYVHLSDNHSYFDKVSFGFQPGYYIISAPANTGKTAYMQTLMLDAVINPKNKKLKLLYFTLDDTKKTITKRFVSLFTRMMNGIPTKINHTAFYQENNAKRNHLYKCYDIVKKLMSDNRMKIVSKKECGSAEQIKRYVRKEYDRDTPIIVAIDGAMNMTTKGRDRMEREDAIANFLMDLADEFEIVVMTNGEMNKDRDAKGLNKIKGSSKLGYNAKVAIALEPTNYDLFNEKIDFRMKATTDKTKMSDDRIVYPLIFDPGYSFMKELTIEQYREYEAIVKDLKTEHMTQEAIMDIHRKTERLINE